MQGYDLYEECTEDGSIPDQVLAFRHGEFRRHQRDPSYQPVAYRILNPRKLEAERKEIEKDTEISAALLNWKEGTLDQPAPNPIPPPPKVDPAPMAPSRREIPWSYQVRPQASSRTIVKPEIVPPRPVSQVPRYPNMSAPQAGPPPIPEKIWKVVNEVKALTPAKGKEYPPRKELKAMRFREYFLSSGEVRFDSELWKFKGDTRLFSKEMWNYLAMEHKTR